MFFKISGSRRSHFFSKLLVGKQCWCAFVSTAACAPTSHPQWGVFAGFASLEHANFGSFRGHKQQLMVRCNQGL